MLNTLYSYEAILLSCSRFSQNSTYVALALIVYCLCQLLESMTNRFTFFTILRNSASSFHWLSSSIFTVRSFGCLLSRIGNTSSHLHNMMFQTIQTIYFLGGYDPGYMSMSFIAELSPVYCCLVSVLLWLRLLWWGSVRLGLLGNLVFN